MQPSEFFAALNATLPALQKKLLSVVAVETENFNDANFEKSGFQGASLEPWQARKNAKDTTRLLVKSGDLRRAATTAQQKAGGIQFVFNMPYAKVHNEGLHSGRGAGFTMPKRQFIGESPQLTIKLKMKFEHVIEGHINSL